MRSRRPWTGITPLVPKPMTSGAKADGRFSKADFIYLKKDDEYQCPAGERAIHRFSREEDGLLVRMYWSSACPGCPMRAQCTTSDYRRIRRWRREHILEAMQRRLESQARSDDVTSPHRRACVRDTEALDGRHSTS